MTSAADRLGVGIIGLGRVAAAHITGFQEQADRAAITAVCDTDGELAARWARETGATAYTDIGALLQDQSVDAVCILLPHLLHHPVAQRALEAGKHVSIEKPLAVSAEQCSALVKLAERSGRVLYVAENTRYVDAYMAVADALRVGALGSIRLVRTMIHGSAVEEYLDPASAWKAKGGGVGALLDAGPHSFYLFKWLFGEIASVQAATRHWLRDHILPNAEVEDGALVTGAFASGGYYSSEFCLAIEIPWGERLEVYGDEGSLIVDQLRDPVAVLHQGPRDLAGTPLKVPFDPLGWKDVSIARSAHDFVSCLLDGASPQVDALDAAYSVYVAECAYRSADSGGVRIALDTVSRTRSD